MCSLIISPIADRHLRELVRSGAGKIEKKICTLAHASSVSQPGPLDETSCHIKGLAADLKIVRRRRIGRHRVFFTGYHTECSYRTFYVKQNKKSGVQDELDQAFQQTLRAALMDPAKGRVISQPKGQQEDED